MRLLLVEDEEGLRGSLADGFREQRCEVEAVGTAAEALRLAREGAFDVIVLDRGLPDGDGVAALRKLRAAGCLTPTLILTARIEVSDRVDGLDAGADDYLTKPFAFAELSARVRALVRRGEPSTVTLQVGDLVLDPRNKSVVRGGQAIELTGTQFALLHLLMRHAGRTVTRKMALDAVWPQGLEGPTNVVDVYVNRLRGKIDKDFEPKLIRTVRGVGYAIGGD
jgi:two-component system OmpR family response regulator